MPEKTLIRLLSLMTCKKDFRKFTFSGVAVKYKMCVLFCQVCLRVSDFAGLLFCMDLCFPLLHTAM